MLIDVSELEPGLRRTEICVVGAGAAGIVAAGRLLELGHEVLLLESGGADYDPRTAALNQGESIGRDYYPLEDARLRFFGGTTAIWGGRCAELDPIDLEIRSWVDGSGWPLEYEVLRRYYDQARPLFGIPSAPASSRDLEDAGLDVPAFDPDLLRMPIWSFDPLFGRFTLAARAELVRHPRCTIVTNATVTEIVPDWTGSHVEELRVRTFGGATLTFAAQKVILAAGGIENARLLLASRAASPDGIGNGYDQVGRCFMEHPHARGGHVVTARAWPLLKLFGKRHLVAGSEVAALIAPSAKLQRDREVLNSSLTIVARRPAHARQALAMRIYQGLKHDVSPTRGGRALWMGTKAAATWAQRRLDPLRPWLLHRLGWSELALLVRAEQAPNPDSRITIGRDADALGVPKVALDWRLSPMDKRSVRVLVDVLGGELRRLGIGDVGTADWLHDHAVQWRTDPLVSAHPIGGYHHMGTTRMSAVPRQGVTDGFGRVHGVDNLFVVGSSTFPTSGWANPTLTIAALALRTADHVSFTLNGPFLNHRPRGAHLVQH